MNNVSEEYFERQKVSLYNNLANKKEVNEDLIPGYVNTPEIPVSVFDLEELSFPTYTIAKPHINEERFFNFLFNKIQENKLSDNIYEKVIVGSQFYKNILDSIKRLENNEIVYDATNPQNSFVGIFWLHDGKNFPIHIPTSRVSMWAQMLNDLKDTSLQPNMKEEANFDFLR